MLVRITLMNFLSGTSFPFSWCALVLVDYSYLLKDIRRYFKFLHKKCITSLSAVQMHMVKADVPCHQLIFVYNPISRSNFEIRLFIIVIQFLRPSYFMILTCLFSALWLNYIILNNKSIILLSFCCRCSSYLLHFLVYISEIVGATIYICFLEGWCVYDINHLHLRFSLLPYLFDLQVEKYFSFWTWILDH